MLNSDLVSIHMHGFVYTHEQITEGMGIVTSTDKIDNTFVYEVLPYEQYSGSYTAPPIWTINPSEVDYFRGMAKALCIIYDVNLD